ncbi:MAG: hypothetical protein VXY83_00460 [Pseudomonadota bacterium]|nr:hypothetical protein [Magnetococcales bacterium]MEC8066945.1 hypothetical protein [Pseudomonadota bacterium]MEC8466806.1 hypothetical protein [Pseudomonadota bacterium]|tara:strand:- start:24179 stop:24415 length:237 start_codon:yes stop_codon:yes gene_type:complete
MSTFAYGGRSWLAFLSAFFIISGFAILYSGSNWGVGFAAAGFGLAVLRNVRYGSSSGMTQLFTLAMFLSMGFISLFVA